MFPIQALRVGRHYLFSDFWSRTSRFLRDVFLGYFECSGGKRFTYICIVQYLPGLELR